MSATGIGLNDRRDAATKDAMKSLNSCRMMIADCTFSLVPDPVQNTGKIVRQFTSTRPLSEPEVPEFLTVFLVALSPLIRARNYAP